MEQLNPDNALSIQHQSWLLHPVTKQMMSILEIQKQSIVTAMSVGSSLNTMDFHWFKECASNIHTIDTIKTWILNTEQFINQLNKK